MIFNLANPYEIAKYDSYIKKLRQKQAVVEVKEKKKNRTLRQNAYLHVLISYFACEYGCSSEKAKYEYYKITCNKDIYAVKKTNKYGKVIEDVRSTGGLTTDEMSLSIDRFRNWSASVASIYLPSPQEHDYLIHCMQVIEENKEFVEQIDI